MVVFIVFCLLAEILKVLFYSSSSKGTGKSTTLCSILNALHLRQYQEYYNAIEKIVTDSNASTYYEELAALNKAAEVKPRILVCAPSNAGIDNVILKIMADRFVDGQGTQYSPRYVVILLVMCYDMSCFIIMEYNLVWLCQCDLIPTSHALYPINFMNIIVLSESAPVSRTQKSTVLV